MAHGQCRCYVCIIIVISLTIFNSLDTDHAGEWPHTNSSRGSDGGHVYGEWPELCDDDGKVHPTGGALLCLFAVQVGDVEDEACDFSVPLSEEREGPGQ